MLAQNFKTAEELDIPETHKAALIKTLVLLETGKLQYRDASGRKSCVASNPSFDGYFNMHNWKAEHPCGTVACIGGTAEIIGGISFEVQNAENSQLRKLFQPQRLNWNSITPEQAATALRSYLTTGDARWDLAVANPTG